MNAKPVSVLFGASTLSIVFKQSAGAITDHNESTKDIDPYFKFQLNVETPDTKYRPYMIK